MYHSVTFGEKNTWDDWRLVPVSRPVFNPPTQKVKTLEIPGGDGVIDLSQALTGYPVYQNRTGSMEFIVMNDFKQFTADPESSIDGKLFRAGHSRFTHTPDEYPAYERQMGFYNCDASLCRMGCLAGFIHTLAITGEIEGRYATEEGALKGAALFQSCTCNCVRDNYQVTGSTTLPPEGMIKLLLNGAVDEIMADLERGEGCCDECP